VDESGESTVPGVYLVGEVAGVPLIKLGLNSGHDIIEQLAPSIREERDSSKDVLDVLIIGAGAAGLGATVRAEELGLSYVTLEANHIAETVYTMTKGKVLYAEPHSVPNKSSLWFEECGKETLLERWRAEIEQRGLHINEFEKVEDFKRSSGSLWVKSNKSEYRARRIVLAVGKAGNPRKAGVPGEVEYAARISHRLLDPDDYNKENILIYGGGDVALEAAIELCDRNEVTLATIDREFFCPKKRNIDALKAKQAEGRVTVHMDSHLVAVGSSDVILSQGGREGPRQTIPNNFLFEMIGAELPTPFFKRVGIKLDNEWNLKRWLYLGAMFAFVYSLYALKSYGKGVSAWPYSRLIEPTTYDSFLLRMLEVAFAPCAYVFSSQAYADILTDRGYQQGYLYSLLYTVIMLWFGFEAMIRWRNVARDKRYQTYRYISLIAFQVVFFLLVNVVAVEALSTKYAWRAWGLYQPFPLFFNTFFWWYEGDPQWIMTFFIGSGLVGTLVAIPIASRKHGKRFCTWVCGCGGLAETLGDRWRHLAAKGKRSRSWEFQGAVILAASTLIALIVVGLYETDGSNIWWHAYSYIVDFWLVAVIPIALYPFFGGKVWCRYWCPLAAYNGLLAKWYGKLKIESNDKCISCTQCSRYCQVGVDVMAFAKNQEAFDNANSACIQCGICIDVCPMDVLSFSTEDALQQKEIANRALPIVV
jgi:thioredoxin reductase/polyferredoxin